MQRGAPLGILALVLAGCGSAPHDASSAVPIGSSITDLDRLYPRGAGSKGEIVEFVGTQERKRGDYDAWRPTHPANFTGEITFYHHGSTSSDVNALTYRNGKLVARDWGFLPG